MKYLILTLMILSRTELQAQVAIPASGGYASESAVSISYSIGQLVYINYTGSNSSIIPGVQQPYEISVLSGIKEATNINIICSVFPNPSTDIIIMKVENYTKEDLSYQLYDLYGNLLENNKIEGNETSIHMVNYKCAPYFLRVV